MANGKEEYNEQEELLDYEDEEEAVPDAGAPKGTEAVKKWVLALLFCTKAYCSRFWESVAEFTVMLRRELLIWSIYATLW